MSANKTIKRKKEIIAAYISVSKKIGINRVTREHVGSASYCCPSRINYYFASMDNLQNRAAWQGVEDQDYYFMRQLWSINHKAVEGWNALEMSK